jgi:hypothetical protein
VSPEPRRKRVRVGELLLEQQLVTQEQLTIALAEQKRTGRKLGRVLTDLGYVSEQAFHEACSWEWPIRPTSSLTTSSRRA